MGYGSVELYPIAKNGHWGYANQEGNLAIDYKFEEVTFFTGGRAATKLNGKFGFINKTGEFEINPKYDSIGYFNYDKANVTKNGKSYTINRKGKIQKEGILIISCGTGMEKTNSNPNDYFIFKNEKHQLIENEFKQQKRLDPTANYSIADFTFEEVSSFSDKSLIVEKDNKFGIYVHYNSIGLKEFWVDEIIPIIIKNNIYNYDVATNAKYRVGNKWGLVSSLGKIEIEPEFYNIKKSIGKYYLVEYKPNHWGCITTQGRYYKSIDD